MRNDNQELRLKVEYLSGEIKEYKITLGVLEDFVEKVLNDNDEIIYWNACPAERV